MKPVTKFLGINNVADETRLAAGEMTAATNVDVGVRNELLSRRGRELLAAGAAHSVFEAPFGVLAVLDNDLVLFDADGAVLRLVYDTIGYTRVWYVLLPDGRVGFSNGLINGLCTATATEAWGFDAPVDAGAGVAGDTPYQIAYVRLSDGREGPPIYGTPIDPYQAIVGLPQLDGFKINVYFAPYGTTAFLAGSTLTDTFLFSGVPTSLGTPAIAHGLAKPPVGTQMVTWGSRVLIADGAVMWATRPFQPELVDLTQDFLQFERDITLLYANDQGVFVGDERELLFLAGSLLEKLDRRIAAPGLCVKGSVVEFDTAALPRDVAPSTSRAALAIVGRTICLLSGAGEVRSLTEGRYETDVTEVHASVRVRDGATQYVAVPS